jgi:transposase-like protein
MKRRKFTREFKLEAVRLIKERGVSYTEASHDLGVHQSQLRHWVKAQADDPVHAFPGQGQMKPHLRGARSQSQMDGRLHLCVESGRLARWLYVAAVIDPFSRRVVGWSMSAEMTAQRRDRRPGDGDLATRQA